MKIAIVIPCYKVKSHILKVISEIPESVSCIYVIDDACPEETGLYVEQNCADKRVVVLFHAVNQGVGGAVITGYKQALEGECDIIVKIDGDGQMDPNRIHSIVAPIINGKADYTKGNRYFYLDDLNGMPLIRLLGGAALSFLNKMVSGYWNIMDPVNGFTAIHASVLRLLPLEKIAKDYFFESDMLFRLGTVRAVVKDITIPACYGDEKSSLKISRVLLNFPLRYLSRMFKRIFYNYFLRDFSAFSIELIAGFLFLFIGVIFGGVQWHHAAIAGRAATSGVVMMAALPILVGIQFLLSAINCDINNVPSECLHVDAILSSNRKGKKAYVES